MADERTRLQVLRDRLWQGISPLDAITLNGHPTQHWPGILNVSFSAITAEALVAALPELAVATGSACTSATTATSHVLRAMGCDPMRARGALRFSFGRFTTFAEIDNAIQAITLAVRRLRDCSPLWHTIDKPKALAIDWAAPV
jgi:cysteine desulfurase